MARCLTITMEVTRKVQTANESLFKSIQNTNIFSFLNYLYPYFCCKTIAFTISCSVVSLSLTFHILHQVSSAAQLALGLLTLLYIFKSEKGLSLETKIGKNFRKFFIIYYENPESISPQFPGNISLFSGSMDLDIHSEWDLEI